MEYNKNMLEQAFMEKQYKVFKTIENRHYDQAFILRIIEMHHGDVAQALRESIQKHNPIIDEFLINTHVSIARLLINIVNKKR